MDAHPQTIARLHQRCSGSRMRFVSVQAGDVLELINALREQTLRADIAEANLDKLALPQSSAASLEAVLAKRRAELGLAST